MIERPVLVWFRQDLRLADNSALTAAIETGRPLVPLYIHAPGEEGNWAPGGASRWWLHHALHDLDGELRERGLRLILRSGPSLDTLLAVARETDADALFWNRRYEPEVVRRDQGIKSALREEGLTAESRNSSLLFEPTRIENKSGKPFQVFTPFYKHYLTLEIPDAVETPLGEARSPESWPESEPLESWKLLPTIRWDSGIARAWDPTRAGARRRLESFRPSRARQYGKQRNRPDIDGTSSLSPYLHCGQIGPREVWSAFTRDERKPVSGFLRQTVWRDFGHHLLFHFPRTTDEPLRENFADFPWKPDERLLTAWQQGRTGYPFVDAGMRHLWATGWMHNRLRMVVASLLVKHLLQPWQRGAEWFWDTLVDADLANNTLGWQWVAGCGADAAPYFRVFNPFTQGEKFDPDGEFTRRWVPELAQLPDRYLQRPWEADASTLAEAGVSLGKTYPRPLVEHGAARQRALDAFETIKGR